MDLLGPARKHVREVVGLVQGGYQNSTGWFWSQVGSLGSATSSGPCDDDIFDAPIRVRCGERALVRPMKIADHRRQPIEYELMIQVEPASR